MSEVEPGKSELADHELEDLEDELVHFPLHRLEKKRTVMEGKNVGHWSLTEKLQYLEFLKTHRTHLTKKELRRTDKIFKEMSKFVETRAADQCRSHHQKMEKKYGSMDAIVQALQNDYNLKVAAQTQKLPHLEETRVDIPSVDEEVGAVFEKSFMQIGQEDNFLSMNLDNFCKEIEFQPHPIQMLEDDDSGKGLFDFNQYFLI